MDEDRVPVCAHVWRLVRVVLDGAGAWRTFSCEACGVVAVQPAAGDLAG